MANPSGSRTMGPTTTSIGKFKSEIIFLSTTTCWASFWPRATKSGKHRLKSFGANSRHSPKMRRAGMTTQAFPNAPPRIRKSNNRRGTFENPREQKPNPLSCFTQLEIAIQITGIFFKILPNAKLGGVYEDGKNDEIGPISHQVDKRQMSFVQKTHRRHQPDRFALIAQLPSKGSHLVHGGYDLHDKIRSKG